MSALESFDHEQYRDEVVDQWGQEAWSRGQSWWKNLGELGQKSFLAEGSALRSGYASALSAGLTIVERHRVWITQAWGGSAPTAEQFRGLADMYVADERFARHYGGPENATFVRDAIHAWTSRTTNS